MNDNIKNQKLIDILKKENAELKIQLAKKKKKSPFPIEAKDCFIIQFNFANGAKPCLIKEDGNFSWKGMSWWIDGNHEKKDVVAEFEHGVECDDMTKKNGVTTMSQIHISVPKQNK